jgi:4-amino-4-deoxy-L-arabinose transferase-like glycosyltransferase
MSPLVHRPKGRCFHPFASPPGTILGVKSPSLHSRVILAFLILLFLLRGFFYCLALPVWEGFDEPYQFAAVQYVAVTGHMPTPTTPVSRQVASSLYLTPAPWMLRLHQLPMPVLTQEDYWKLPPQEREKLRNELLALPQSWSAEASNPAIENYEGQQAPLYYFVASPVLRAVSNLTLPGQVFALRLFGLLLACGAVLLGYMLALQVLSDSWLALLATALVVAMPELFIDICRVSNEPLAILLCTALLLLIVKFVQSSQPGFYLPAIALTLGLALLTKGYFLAFVPAVAFILWMRLRASRGGVRLLSSLALSLAILAVVAGPWYWHMHRISGSWSGQADDVAVHHVSRLALLAQVIHVNWRSGFASILLSHVWFGGWSFLRFPAWIYACVLLPVAVAVAGMCTYFWRWLRSGMEPDPVVAIATFYLCFWAALCYHVLVTYVHLGVSASTGWYLYCLVFAEAVLLAQGLAQLFGSKALHWLIAAGITLLAIIDLYGVHAYMLPYYTGLTAHVGERVPALKLTAFSVSQIFSLLAMLGPAWVSPGLLKLAWGGYMLATLGLVLLGWSLIRWARLRQSA